MSGGDPRRLRQDPSAPSALREDLARAAGAVPAYDVAKGLARFQATIGGGSGGGPTGGGGAIAAKSTTWWWIGGGAAVATLAAIGAMVASTPAAPRATHARPLAARQQPAPAPQPRAETHGGVPSSRPAATASSHAVEVSAPSHARSRAPGHDARAQREIEQAGRADALLATDPAQSLALANAGHRQFGRQSLMAEEREAIAIDALARLRRTEEVSARAARFLRLHPRSLLRERVERALARGTR